MLLPKLAPGTAVAVLLTVLPVALPPLAEALPQQRLAPGGVAVIALAPLSASRPLVSYRDRPVLVAAGNRHWHALIGISLQARRGLHSFEVTTSDQHGRPSRRQRSFTVREWPHYQEQHLTVEKKYVEIPPGTLARIQREKAHLGQVKGTLSIRQPSLDFAEPLAGVRSGSFGSRRVFNGRPRRPHSGMDIAAPEGTPIQAPASGTVIDSGDYYFNGKTLVLDHGRGLISLFCHLSQVDVQPGQQVERGALLGRVGSTGRVTGPHLHWSLGLNGNWIDPELFLQ